MQPARVIAGRPGFEVWGLTVGSGRAGGRALTDGVVEVTLRLPPAVGRNGVQVTAAVTAQRHFIRPEGPRLRRRAGAAKPSGSAALKGTRCSPRSGRAQDDGRGLSEGSRPERSLPRPVQQDGHLAKTATAPRWAFRAVSGGIKVGPSAPRNCIPVHCSPGGTFAGGEILNKIGNLIELSHTELTIIKPQFHCQVLTSKNGNQVDVHYHSVTTFNRPCPRGSLLK